MLAPLSWQEYFYFLFYNICSRNIFTFYFTIFVARKQCVYVFFCSYLSGHCICVVSTWTSPSFLWILSKSIWCWVILEILNMHQLERQFKDQGLSASIMCQWNAKSSISLFDVGLSQMSHSQSAARTTGLWRTHMCVPCVPCATKCVADCWKSSLECAWARNKCAAWCLLLGAWCLVLGACPPRDPGTPALLLLCSQLDSNPPLNHFSSARCTLPPVRTSTTSLTSFKEFVHRLMSKAALLVPVMIVIWGRMWRRWRLTQRSTWSPPPCWRWSPRSRRGWKFPKKGWFTLSGPIQLSKGNKWLVLWLTCAAVCVSVWFIWNGARTW